MPVSRPVRLAALCVLAFASGTSSAATPDAGIPLPGIEVANMDRSVRPGDDFYGYANGTWLKTHEIPADRAAWGASGELAERLLTQTRTLLEAAATASAATGTLERKVGDFYASAMDEAAAEKRGLTPLQPALARIASVKSRTDLATYLGEQLRADVDAMDCTDYQTSRLFGLWVAPDLNAPARSAAYLL
ncbi:MAG: M13 family peptidase, partial [Myxococcaceae bacterium]